MRRHIKLRPPLTAEALGALGLVLAGGMSRTIGLVVLGVYGIGLALTGAFAMLRFRSTAVGLVTPLVVVLTQGAYVVGFARGLLDSTTVPRAVPADSAPTHNLEA